MFPLLLAIALIGVSVVLTIRYRCNLIRLPKKHSVAGAAIVLIPSLCIIASIAINRKLLAVACTNFSIQSLGHRASALYETTRQQLVCVPLAEQRLAASVPPGYIATTSMVVAIVFAHFASVVGLGMHRWDPGSFSVGRVQLFV